MEENGLVVLTEEYLISKIYVIKGIKVMLDSDLAEIYGYETKAFNQQVKNNIVKFDGDFRFQLTNEEYENVLRSSFLTSNEMVAKTSKRNCLFLSIPRNPKNPLLRKGTSHKRPL